MCRKSNIKCGKWKRGIMENTGHWVEVFFEKEFACSKNHRCIVWEVWQMCTPV